MPETHSVVTHSMPIGEYLGSAFYSAQPPKLLDNLREAFQSCHSFAGHLLECGYDIRTIQELLGHKDVTQRVSLAHGLTAMREFAKGYE